MKRHKLLLLMLIFVILCTSAYAQTRVYVYAKEADGGFVDSGRIESTVADLKAAVNKLKNVRVTDLQGQAQIKLEVVNSGPVAVGTQSNTRAGVFGGINTTTTNKTLPNVTAVLHVVGSDYQKELSITNQMFWKDLAKQIAKQLDDWLKVNQAKLNP